MVELTLLTTFVFLDLEIQGKSKKRNRDHNRNLISSLGKCSDRVTLQVDALDDAIGGVLLQNVRPICFTSLPLSSTERNYAQIEKECLAIVSCMEKWHQYLYGKHEITMHTDHQPLETIFKTEAPQQSPAKITKNDAKTAKVPVQCSV